VLRRLTAALLAAGAAVPAWAGTGSTDSADTAQPSPPDNRGEIVITAPSFRDIVPERELDQDGIESYGVSTIDELLGEVQAELGDDEEQPLIIVNGHRISDPGEIGALPVEALRSLQVLPRGSAVKAGGKNNQRVISLTLRKTVRSATLTGAEKVATQGDWHGERGEAILTSVHGDTRANLAFRMRNESRLLESARSIIEPDPRLPYALGGNIIGYPGTAGEIDPLLSAAAGQIVTVVPFPAIANPTLADLVAAANRPAETDLAAYRTLRPRSRTYDVNATFSTQVAPWLNATGTLRYNRRTSDSLRGLASTLFVLSPANPASPFDNPVGLALYGPDPLHSLSRSTGGEGNVTLDAEFGRWSANLQAGHKISDFSSTSERAASSTVTLDDSINPFGGGLASLIAIRSDRASSHAVDDVLDLTIDGTAARLPAGDLHAVAEGVLNWSRLHSTSSYSTVNPDRDFRRDQQSLRGALDIPLTSRENNFLGQIGNLNAAVEYTRIHFSDAGSLDHHSFALTWEPIPALRLRGSIDETDAPAPIQTIGDPTIISTDVRMFDPLTGETVDVTQITGGNPSLLPQTTRVRNLSAQLRLLPKYNLRLTADYFDTDRRHFLSSLPEASAAVMLAFPDRFVRDSNGVLTTVDLRPVNFDSDREKRLRWGLSLNRKIFGASAPAAGAKISGAAAKAGPSTYFQLTANHTMVFSDEIRIRPGLAPVDLLDGGAIGIGGGRVRHQLDATAAVTSGGVGVRAGLTWRGKSSLVTRIGSATDTLEFSPLAIVNLRLFAEAKRLFPNDKWAKGLRLSIDALNLTNDRQKVRDSAGVTPLQYQPAYRDPLGRTIEFEIRKVF
jgi:hypothetical protein